MKKILICGGGTAGHIYPAVAVIEYIKKVYPECRLLFVGTEKGMENRLMSDINIAFKSIKATGLEVSRGGLKKFFNSLRFGALLVLGFFQSCKIIIKFRPDIVLGMGGYVCGPVILASILFRKEYALHEQNYIPGRLNSLFSRFAKYVFISFEETKKFLKHKNKNVILTGNPVRENIKSITGLKKDYKKWGLYENRFTVVVFGGSLGAEKINDVVTNLYSHLRGREDIQVILICGFGYYNKCLEKVSHMIKDNDRLVFRIYPYINQMEEIYGVADLIVSRAGANTVAELLATGIPAILIPYPYAVGNHQFFNASFLEKNGRALILPDEHLNENSLWGKIEDLLKQDKNKYRQLKQKKIDFYEINGEKIIANYLIRGEN